MLAQFTHALNLIAMSAALWMAFYLFARGFPNRITLRASLALFAISVFFLDTYNHYFTDLAPTANFRAALLVIALTCWYSVTHALLTPEQQKKKPITFRLPFTCLQPVRYWHSCSLARGFSAGRKICCTPYGWIGMEPPSYTA